MTWFRGVEEARGGERGGVGRISCLEVFTSAFETKIRAAQVWKWSSNNRYTWSEF